MDSPARGTAPPAEISPAQSHTPPGASPVALNAVPFHYVQTDSFVAVLAELRMSLTVSTYQANKLLVARVQGSGLSTLVRTFERPMGLAVDGDRLTIGTRKEVWFLRNAPDLAPQVEPAGQHDACFLPRSCHVTGDIGVHEIAWASAKPESRRLKEPEEQELWIVNTRFSCLCTLHPDFSFVPRWQPPFITALVPEDRCHLNGLAIVAGRPKYVTALGESNTDHGWRNNKPQGGCLIDVEGQAVISRGLSMPHSPRWHAGHLWLLESGNGRLLRVETTTGHRETVADLPGFTRGLALCGPYAFIGLSKIRATSAMDGVPLAERRGELKCGIAVIDLRTGQNIAFLEFETAVEEIFDVQLLPGSRFPEIVGFQKDTLNHTFILPRHQPY